MATAVLWFGVAMSLAGLAYAFIVGRAARAAVGGKGGPSDERGYVLYSPVAWAGCVLLACFLATLATEPPASEGQGLGWGLLIGGAAGIVAALLVGWLTGRTEEPEATPSVASSEMGTAAALGLASLAVLPVNVALIGWHGYPTAVLMGVALGACLIAGVVRLAMSACERSIGGRARAFGALDMFALFTVLLAGAVVLAVLHFDEAARRAWWSLPTALGGALILGIMLDAALGLGQGACSGAAVLRILIPALMARLVGWHMLGSSTPFWALVTGLVAFGIIAWLLHTACGRDGAAPMGWRVKAGLLGPLVVVAAAMIGFKLQAGFGVATMLLGGMTVAAYALALPFCPRQPEPGASDADEGARTSGLSAATSVCMAVGVLLVINRLLLERYVDLPAMDFTVHYVLMGLLVGVGLPFALAAWQSEASEAGGAQPLEVAMKRSLGWVAGVGIVAVAVAPLLAVLWGMKIVAGLVAGLIAAQVLALVSSFEWCEPTQNRGMLPMVSATVPVGIALIAAQIAPVFAEYSTMPRTGKVWIVIAVGVIGVVWMLLKGATGVWTGPEEGEL